MNEAITWALANGWVRNLRADTLRKVKGSKYVDVFDEHLQGLTLEQAKRALVEAEETLDT